MEEWVVDTNVILDELGAAPAFGERSRTALERCAESGALVINPIVFAEVGVFVDGLEELDEFLPLELFRRDAVPWEGALLAGHTSSRYRLPWLASG